jgi:hypothetical protein
MEKRYFPRIWRNWKRYEEMPSGCNAYICYDDNIIGPSIEYISKAEHDAIVQPLVAALEEIAKTNHGMDCDHFSNLLALKVLEKFKERTG